MTRAQTALITGSTDGLGRQVALRLAESGFRVLVHGHDRGRGKIVVEEIRAAGGSARFLEADLASLAAVRELSEEVMRESASLELLINNAGIGAGARGAARTTSVDGYENCLHPASLMDTHMVREAGIAPSSSVEEGTHAVVSLALSSERPTGLYLNGTQPARAHEQAYEEAARARLRTLSRELAGLGLE
jgi:NAD(P)-dependent dehydrogenase (short-subunit alcohol dehydrogenase family)